MTITELWYCLSLKKKYMDMIAKFLTDNFIEIETFVIVSRRTLLDEDFNPCPPRTAWIQNGELVEKKDIDTKSFFFQIVDGPKNTKTIIVPVPSEEDD